MSKVERAVKTLIERALIEADYHRAHTVELLRFYIQDLLSKAYGRTEKEYSQIVLIVRGLEDRIKLIG